MCSLANYLCRFWGEVSSSPLLSPGRLVSVWLTVNGWRRWLSSTFILTLSIQVEPGSISLGEEPEVTLFFPPLCCLQCHSLKTAVLLSQTSPLGHYPGFGLNRERIEAVVETLEGCPHSSKIATPQKPAFSSSKEIPSIPLLILFLGKHLPLLDLQRFEEEWGWGPGSTLQTKDLRPPHTRLPLPPAVMRGYLITVPSRGCPSAGPSF